MTLNLESCFLFSGRSTVKEISWAPRDDVDRLEILKSYEYPNLKSFFSIPKTITNASWGEKFSL